MARPALRDTKFGGGGTPEAIPLSRDATGQEARAGKKFLVDVHSPTPFLFARPSGNYQNSASGFSLKKVRILFRTDSRHMLSQMTKTRTTFMFNLKKLKSYLHEILKYFNAAV